MAGGKRVGGAASPPRRGSPPPREGRPTELGEPKVGHRHTAQIPARRNMLWRKAVRRVDLMDAYLFASAGGDLGEEGSNDRLIAVPVEEVLTVPQCFKMKKPSTDVV